MTCSGCKSVREEFRLCLHSCTPRGCFQLCPLPVLRGALPITRRARRAERTHGCGPVPLPDTAPTAVRRGPTDDAALRPSLQP